MTRSISLIALLFAAQSALAGITYQFTSETTGMTSQSIKGTVLVEGPKMRIDFTTGDGMLFANGSRAISSDGGNTLTVADPRAKTFYTIDLGAILGGPDSVVRQMGGLLKFDVRNPKVSVSDRGAGPAIEGYTTRRSAISNSYDMIVDAMGQKMTIGMSVATDVWWTDRLSAEYTNFLQARGVKTGIEALDKHLAAQTAMIKGFPLKQVTTTSIVMNGKAMKSTSTSTVSAIRKLTIAPAEFAIPAGYKKVASPMEKLTGK